MKHKMNIYLIQMFVAAISLSISLTDCWGYEEERARDNFSHELVICAAYYDVGAEGARRVGEKEGAFQMELLAGYLMEMAREYTRDDVLLARYKLAFEDHVKTMDGDYANLSLLIVKYKDLCKQVVENPEARLKYWRDKK